MDLKRFLQLFLEAEPSIPEIVLESVPPVGIERGLLVQGRHGDVA